MVPEVTIYFEFKCADDGLRPWGAGQSVFAICEDIVENLLVRGKAMVSDRVATTPELSKFLADDYDIHDVILGVPGKQYYLRGPSRPWRDHDKPYFEQEAAIFRTVLASEYVEYAWLGPFDSTSGWHTFSEMTVVFKPRGKAFATPFSKWL